MNIGEQRIFYACKCGLENEIVGDKTEAKNHRKRICPYCAKLTDHKILTLQIVDIE